MVLAARAVRLWFINGYKLQVLLLLWFGTVTGRRHDDATMGNVTFARMLVNSARATSSKLAGLLRTSEMMGMLSLATVAHLSASLQLHGTATRWRLCRARPLRRVNTGWVWE